MRTALVLVLAGAGCEVVVPLDLPDSGTTARQCSWVGGPRVTSVRKLDELVIPGARYEWDPFLTADGADFFFNTGSGSIYHSRRRPDGSFEPPSTYSEVPQMTASRIEISSDGTFAVVAASAAGMTMSELYSLSRVSPALPWGDLSVLLATPDVEYDPHITADQLELYYAAGQPQALVHSHRADRSMPFPPGTPIEELASVYEASPSLTADERLIVFTSHRSGDAAIWYATRPGSNGAFDPPTELELRRELAIPGAFAATLEPFVTADGCTLFFAGIDPADTAQTLYVADLAQG